MKAKTLLLLGLFLLVATQAFPCLNKTSTTYGGGSGRYYGSWRLKQAIELNLAKDGAEMEARLRNSNNYNDRSDYAIALMYLGRAPEAVKLLQTLEKEQPGNFFIAANLGTAYELSGKNTEALQWINEGIRRNPADHEGTEWLHSKILEAKIAQGKDPAYFDTHSVLELDPAKITGPVDINGKTISLPDLLTAIQYQLGERLQFVKPPDPAVASLLFDYASIQAVNSSMEGAQETLKLATQYGYPSVKVDALNREFEKRLTVAHAKSIAGYSIIGLVCVTLVTLLFRRRLIVFTRKPHRA